MINSSSKIKQKSSDSAIDKLKSDFDIIEENFGDNMTKRAMKKGLEVIEDLISFFESSVAFI